MFQRPRPRNGFERPERPSEASSTGLKPFDTANGSPNKFNPVPGVGHGGPFRHGGFGLRLGPTPLDAVTLWGSPSPQPPGSTAGTLPALKPRAAVPPPTW